MIGSPFLRLSGAVVGIAPDAEVAAHYGEPLREQRVFARGAAVVDASHLGVVRLGGVDRLEWLSSISTQVYSSGVSAEGLILSPQGRIEHAFALIDDGECAYLVTEAESAAPLAAFFTKMRFMKRVEIDDLSDDLFVLATMGDALEIPAIAPNGTPIVWRDPWVEVVAGGTQYAAVAVESHPGRSFKLRLHLVDAAGRDSVCRAVRDGELQVAGMMSLEALRVAAWRPRFAREIDERALPHEVDLLRSAVHLEKGCYRGQEAVAKVHNLGHPPRRLALLDLDGMDGRLPAPNALVRLGGKPVGRITSVVLHYDEGPIALALLKRAVDPQADLVVDLELQPQVADGAVAESSEGTTEQVDAAQTVIVALDAGDAANMQQLRRQLRGR